MSIRKGIRLIVLITCALSREMKNKGENLWKLKKQLIRAGFVSKHGNLHYKIT